VTKGAFEAGVLQVLAQRGIAVERIVAASSGALNGVVYAAGVRARRERAAAAELVELWESHGGWRDVLHLSLSDLLCLRGISDQKNLYALLHASVLPSNAFDPAPIELHLITAPLRGSEGSTLDEPATTYTHVVSFGGQWFDEQEALDRVLTAATASAALPILYTPVDLPGLGPCVDGGLVANTPIRYAYGEDEGASIDAILVVAATPAFLGQPGRDYRGGDLVAHVVDMLFSEWLYQDLRRSRAINEGLRAVAALAEKKGWSPAEQEEIGAALGWERRHVVPIISIRPTTPLPGTLFSGFTDRAVRRQWVAVGRQRAVDVLEGLGWR
jgi:predicted acylesterase/phospholipase RssA